MKTLKRILSLSFLTVMLGIPIAVLSSTLTEVQAASTIPIAKIRYLDAGDYHDIAYNDNGTIDEANSIVNESVKEFFCNTGVRDSYTGQIVKFSTEDYKKLASGLKNLTAADGSTIIQKETGDKVRYIVWYNMDKKRSNTTYWHTEGYYVTPDPIYVKDNPTANVSSKSPNFYIPRQPVGSTTYTGRYGQEWQLTVYAIRYDYFQQMYEKLDRMKRLLFQEDNERQIFYLQPVIGYYKNQQKVEPDLLTLNAWKNVTAWADDSTFWKHYDVQLAVNMTNRYRLFVHYIEENSEGATINSKEYPLGKPVVDESDKDDFEKVYSIHNYTPGDDAANEANGIEIATPSTFPLGEGPVEYNTQERVDIFKENIPVTVVDEATGEEVEKYWCISGVQLKYLSDEDKSEQYFKIKFLYDDEGNIDTEVKMLKDNRDDDFEANKPVYIKNEELGYDEFLKAIKKTKVTTASAGDTIVFFEYKLLDEPWPWSRNRGGNTDQIKIEYQYQTFDAQGNVVWETMKPDEYEPVPENRSWGKVFDNLGEDPYQNYGIYSVHATDTASGRKLLNAYTNTTETIAQNFYDTTQWEAEADTVRKVAYRIPTYDEEHGPITVTVRYAARMPMVKLSYLASKSGDTTTYKLIEGPTTIGRGGAGQKQAVSWSATYDEMITTTNSETGEDEQTTLTHPFKYWYVTEGEVAGFATITENCWTETEPPVVPADVFTTTTGEAAYQVYNPTIVVAFYGEPDEPTAVDNTVTIKYEYQTYQNGEVVWKQMKESEVVDMTGDDWETVFPAIGEDEFKYYGIYSTFATNNANNSLIPNELTGNEAEVLEYFYDDDMWKEKNDTIRTVKYDVSDVGSMTVTVRYAARMPMIKLNYLYTNGTYQLQGEPVNLGLGAAGQTRQVIWEETLTNTDNSKTYNFDGWYKTEGDVAGFCGTTQNCWTETSPPALKDGATIFTSLTASVEYAEFNPTIVYAVYTDPDEPATSPPLDPDPEDNKLNSNPRIIDTLLKVEEHTPCYSLPSGYTVGKHAQDFVKSIKAANPEYSCQISTDTSKSDQFDVEQGIPSSEYERIDATVNQYETDQCYTKYTRKLEYRITVYWTQHRGCSCEDPCPPHAHDVRRSTDYVVSTRPTISYYKLKHYYAYLPQDLAVYNGSFPDENDNIQVLQAYKNPNSDISVVGLDCSDNYKYHSVKSWTPSLGGCYRSTPLSLIKAKAEAQVASSTQVRNDFSAIWTAQTNWVINSDYKWCTNNTKVPTKAPEPEPTPDYVFTKKNIQIPYYRLNDVYPSKAAVCYEKASYYGKWYDSVVYGIEVNDVIVHTPVVNDFIIVKDNTYCQLTKSDEEKQVVLDTKFKIYIPAVGTHLDIPAYGTRDYSKWVDRWEVKFPIDTYLVTDDNKPVFKPKDTWFEVDSGITTFLAATWNDEMVYTFQSRTIAINCDPNDKRMEQQNNANMLRENYVARNLDYAEVSGRIYGLNIFDVSDYPLWQNVFRVNNTYTKTGFQFYSGLSNQYGVYGPMTASETFPMVEGDHPQYSTEGVPPLGYTIRFSVETVGTMNDGNDYVMIKPKFYYVSKDGKTRYPVDVYYGGAYISDINVINKIM